MSIQTDIHTDILSDINVGLFFHFNLFAAVRADNRLFLIVYLCYHPVQISAGKTGRQQSWRLPDLSDAVPSASAAGDAVPDRG